MNIKFLKGAAGIGLAYVAGDEAEFNDVQAKELIDSEFAIEVDNSSIVNSEIETATVMMSDETEQAVVKQKRVKK
jgi:hypothetical protein